MSRIYQSAKPNQPAAPKPSIETPKPSTSPTPAPVQTPKPGTF